MNKTHTSKLISTANVEIFLASLKDTGVTFNTIGTVFEELNLSDGKTIGRVQFSTIKFPDGAKVSFPFNLSRQGKTVYVPGSKEIIEALVGEDISLKRDGDPIKVFVTISVDVK